MLVYLKKKKKKIIKFTLDGFYPSTTNCWTGIPVQPCNLPVQRTGGRVPG